MREPLVLQPHNLASLVEALGSTSPHSRFIAGGTDLMLQLRNAAALPEQLIDLTGLPELRGIHTQNGRLHVGAMTRFDELAVSAEVQASAACLAQAAASVGSMQIRAMATLGGNVANASPCADTVPALLVLNADVGVLTKDGSVVRRPFVEVLEAARRKCLPYDEVLFDFAWDLAGPGARSAFAKLGARTAVTIAKLNAALVIESAGPNAPVTKARAAFGSLAPVAMLDSVVAQTLVGEPLNDAAIERFASACTALVDRAIPGRASHPYKRMAIKGLAHDLLAVLTKRSHA